VRTRKSGGKLAFPTPRLFEVESCKKCFTLPEPEAVPTGPTLNSWSTITAESVRANFSVILLSVRSHPGPLPVMTKMPQGILINIPGQSRGIRPRKLGCSLLPSSGKFAPCIFIR
jgi:hypothetical protein